MATPATKPVSPMSAARFREVVAQELVPFLPGAELSDGTKPASTGKGLVLKLGERAIGVRLDEATSDLLEISRAQPFTIEERRLVQRLLETVGKVARHCDEFFFPQALSAAVRQTIVTYLEYPSEALLLRVLTEFESLASQTYEGHRIAAAIGLDEKSRSAGVKLEAIWGEDFGKVLIVPDDAEGEPPLLPVLNRYKPIGTSAEVDFTTTRPCHGTQKSHVNQVVLDTRTWESSVAFRLEASEAVERYVRNDHLGLLIPYEFQGVDHTYEPDFIVRLATGLNVLLEVKGFEDAQTIAKHHAARRWVGAVNNAREHGDWLFHVCRDPQTLEKELSFLTSPKAEPAAAGTSREQARA